jgi:hypothetical protein
MPGLYEVFRIKEDEGGRLVCEAEYVGRAADDRHELFSATVLRAELRPLCKDVHLRESEGLVWLIKAKQSGPQIDMVAILDAVEMRTPPCCEDTDVGVELRFDPVRTYVGEREPGAEVGEDEECLT